MGILDQLGDGTSQEELHSDSDLNVWGTGAAGFFSNAGMGGIGGWTPPDIDYDPCTDPALTLREKWAAGCFVKTITRPLQGEDDTPSFGDPFEPRPDNPLTIMENPCDSPFDPPNPSAVECDDVRDDIYANELDCPTPPDINCAFLCEGEPTNLTFRYPPSWAEYTDALMSDEPDCFGCYPISHTDIGGNNPEFYGGGYWVSANDPDDPDIYMHEEVSQEELDLVTGAWNLLQWSWDVVEWLVCLLHGPDVADCVLDHLYDMPNGGQTLVYIDHTPPRSIQNFEQGGLFSVNAWTTDPGDDIHVNAEPGGEFETDVSQFATDLANNADADVLCLEVKWAAILLHELLHSCLGAPDRGDEPNNCDTTYMLMNSFAWAMSQRFPCIDTNDDVNSCQGFRDSDMWMSDASVI